MIIVYTSILGGSDSLKPAPTGADQCVCFVDDPAVYPDPLGWELMAHVYGNRDPRRDAWRLRCVPHLLFTDYDRVVWIDASFTLTNLPLLLRDAGDAPIAALRHHARKSFQEEGREIVRTGQASAEDVYPQLRDYEHEGFKPEHLSISCIIVRDSSSRAKNFGGLWDVEISSYRGDNTQISLDYAAWTAGTEIRALTGTRHDNPYATHDARDHKKRRKPYLVPA